MYGEVARWTPGTAATPMTSPNEHIQTWVDPRLITNCFFWQKDMGMGQKSTTRGPQVLVLGSIWQGSILST